MYPIGTWKRRKVRLNLGVHIPTYNRSGCALRVFLFFPPRHTVRLPLLSLLPHSIHALPENGKAIPSKTVRGTRGRQKEERTSSPTPLSSPKKYPKSLLHNAHIQTVEQITEMYGEIHEIRSVLFRTEAGAVLVSPPIPRGNELISNN